MRDRLNGAARARVLLSSDSQSWNTPPAILERVRRLGPIGLDPCSNLRSIVGARVSWTIDDDGLSRSWCGLGLVYCNPPYGDELPTWIAKCDAEARAGAEIVALVPARPDTRHFSLAARRAVIGLWRGRITYGGAGSTAPFPVCLPYWGRRRAAFVRALRSACVSFVGGDR